VESDRLRRWEKELGLPVRRVPGGRGRSVFAYSGEIDAWLKAAPPSAPAPGTGPDAVRGTGQDAAPAPARGPWLWRAAAAAAVVGAIALTAWRVSSSAVPLEDLRIEQRPDGIYAFDRAGREQWRHTFSPEVVTHYSELSPSLRVVGGARPAVYVATEHQTRRADNRGEGGTLTWLDARGQVQQRFEFDDQVRVGGMRYGPPWALTAFAVEDRPGERRVAVAGHHYTWHPSVVTLLDDRWRRRATFVHAGWVETLAWLSPDRLLIGGYSEPQGGGMVAVLDPADMTGQGPEEPGARYFCESCTGGSRPLRMIVMPRSEVNLASLSRFNRALVEVTADRLIVRTVEVPPSGQGAADAIYEFTPALELIRASFSDRYWDVHRALEDEGKLDHPRSQCPDRDGPRQIRVWDRAAGWRTQ
jgi:hypothetical protein